MPARKGFEIQFFFEFQKNRFLGFEPGTSRPASQYLDPFAKKVGVLVGRDRREVGGPDRRRWNGRGGQWGRRARATRALAPTLALTLAPGLGTGTDPGPARGPGPCDQPACVPDERPGAEPVGGVRGRRGTQGRRDAGTHVRTCARTRAAWIQDFFFFF